jgi:hypothetical protein
LVGFLTTARFGVGSATGNASRVIAEMATPGLIVSALRQPMPHIHRYKDCHGSGYGHCASLQLGDVFTTYAKQKAPRLLREAEGLASGSELFGCHGVSIPETSGGHFGQ